MLEYNKSSTLQQEDPWDTIIISWWKYFVLDFNKKASLFKYFYASICTPIKYASTLPSFSYRTHSRTNSFHAAQKGILLKIKSLDTTKGHVCDKLWIRMINICKESITILLKIIFEESLKNDVFPEIWK